VRAGGGCNHDDSGHRENWVGSRNIPEVEWGGTQD
jgi:hypothetical protein